MRFALNHIVAPKLPLRDFFAMARRLGITDVEIRNDLPDVVGSMAPEAVKSAADEAGVAIIAINALYPFNIWLGDLPARAVRLADYARACGAQGLVMCPLNEGTNVSYADLVTALSAMAPILLDRALTGLVEPLGFPGSSLRMKREAIDAIQETRTENVYKLVHDTFHHHLAGETELFPGWTGLVHISGVTDTDVDVSAMQDAHRVLVDENDRLENIGQLGLLRDAAYSGPASLEPFSAKIHEGPAIESHVAACLEFVSTQLA